MTWQELAAIGSITATLVALGALFFTKILPAIRKWGRFLDRVAGIPSDKHAGQPNVPGLFERMDQQDAALVTQADAMDDQNKVLEKIRHEVEYNNGSSVKDAVARTEAGITDLTAQITELSKQHGDGAPPTTTINISGGDSNAGA